MAAPDYGQGFAKELNPRDAEREAEHWEALDRAEDYTRYIEEQAHLAALEMEGELDPDAGTDPTPDSTRPDGLYQAPRTVAPWCWGRGR